AEVAGLAFTPDGKTLASFAYDRTVRAWSLATGQETRRWGWQGTRGIPGGLVAFPDSKSFAFGGAQDRLRTLDLQSGKELHCKSTPEGTTPGALSRDGKRLVTVSTALGPTCTLWDVPQAEKVRVCAHARKGK